MAKYDDKLFEDQPYDEELFEDTQYDEDLFEDETTDITPEFEAPTSTAVDAPKQPADYVDPEIGAVEAFGLGTASTFGPIVGGASAVAGETYGRLSEGKGLPSLKEAKETYYEGRDYTKERQAKGFKDQPLPSIGGMVVEGIAMGAPAKLLSKGGKLAQGVSKVLPSLKSAEKVERVRKTADKLKDLEHMHEAYKKLNSAKRTLAVASAAKEGAKYGGLTGLFAGEGKLFEGEVGKIAQETLTGTGVGGATGVLFGGGIEAIRGIKDYVRTRTLVEPYILGKKGLDLSDKQKVSFVRKFTKELHKDLSDEFRKIGLTKEEAMKMADEAGIRIKTFDDVINAVDQINEMELPETHGDAKAFVNLLKRHMGISKDMDGLRDKMEKKLVQLYQAEMGLDEVAARKLANKNLERTLKTMKKPQETVTGDVGMKDIYPESEFPQIRKKVAVSKMKPEIDPKTGAELPPKMKVDVEDISKAAPQITEGVDPMTGRNFINIKDSATGKSSIMVGGKAIPQLSKEGATFTQVEDLYRKLQGFTETYGGNQMPLEVKKQATKLRSKLRDLMDQKLKDVSGQEYSKINRKFLNLYDALERAGIKTKPMEYGTLYEDQLLSMARLFESKADMKESFKVLKFFTESLRKGSPEVYNKHKKGFETIRQLIKYAEDPSVVEKGQISTAKGLVGTVIERLIDLSNKIGRAQAQISKVPGAGKLAVRSMTKKVLASSPDEIQVLIDKIAKKGGKYKQFLVPLEKIKTSKAQTKNALLYTLMQNPVFRELISDKKEKE